MGEVRIGGPGELIFTSQINLDLKGDSYRLKDRDLRPRPTGQHQQLKHINHGQDWLTSSYTYGETGIPPLCGWGRGQCGLRDVAACTRPCGLRESAALAVVENHMQPLLQGGYRCAAATPSRSPI